MIFLYNIGILLYSLTVRIASPFNKKARLFVRGRKNWKKNLPQKIEKDSKYIWFHCASLGEFEQGRPLIEEIKEKYPAYKIILTFFSPSGYEIRKNYPLADCVLYLPPDTRQNAKTFLNIVKPEKAFFVKYEYWYHYINQLKKQEIPLFLISGIFREKQVFFKNNFWGKWYRKILCQFNHFFVQNNKSGIMLNNIGLTNYSVSGDTRFDRVAAITRQAKELSLVNKFKGKSKLVVAGSTWKPDEEIIATFIHKNPDVKFIIAPHEVSQANINRLSQLLKNKAILYSTAANAAIETSQVLIIDSIGLLSSLYRYGDIACIGGGFGVGIHNILEAATFGLPVIFGPNYKKFAEAVDLVALGGAFPVKNQAEFDQILKSLLTEKKKQAAAAQASKKYVEKNVGATKFIIKKVFNTQNILALFLLCLFFLKI